MRILGRTNLKIYEVGLGGIPIQRVGQAEVNDIINTMHQLGMNFIDTARAYSNSEELLGHALLGRREDFIIATKSMAKTYEQMKADIHLSLEKLQTNYIDIYQIHNPKRDLNLRGILKALNEAKALGKIGYIGVSNHSSDYLKELLLSNNYDTIQFPYNFLEAQGKDLFSLAKAMNVGVIVMKPLAGGVIEKGNLALKYIMKNPNVSIAIPGMASTNEVIENYHYDKGDYTQDELDYMEKLRIETDKDFCHRCGYCLPCPQGIDIPTMFTFEAYYKRYGLKDWAKERYQSLSINASACVECRICESRCPYNLRIVEKIKKVRDVFINDNCEES